MATKEDILEQIAEEYLLHQGYFVQHNIKFRPSNKHKDYVKQSDSNHSDIDILACHPLRQGVERVFAVSCKSWQGGFDPKAELEAIANNKIVAGRERWKAYRELVVPKWSEAFRESIFQLTGATKFTYITAVTRVKGDRSSWENHQPFQELLGGNPLRVLDLNDMLRAVLPSLKTTVANTSIGRFLQLVKAAEIEIKI
jgi:hypothetical protein